MNSRPLPKANWRDLALGCVRDIAARLAVCIFIAVVVSRFIGGVWPTVWLGATLIMQFAAVAVIEATKRGKVPETGPRARLCKTVLALSPVVFSAVSVVLWFEGGVGGQICGMLVLAGGVVSVASEVRVPARQLWIAHGSFALLLIGMPLISAVLAQGAEREAMALVTVCAGFFVSRLVVANKRGVDAASAIDQALFEARVERMRAGSADRAKGNFLSAMGHELRTPLNGVLGMAQIMETDELTPRQRERLGVVKQSGEQLLILINDLLDIARIEDETLELDEGLIDLRQLAAQTEAVFAPLAEAKALTLHVRHLESAGALRIGDPARVRQILHNLVANAIKFTSDGSVHVVLRGSAEELIYEVSDTGAGIAPDRLATIFERFYQSDGSASRRHGGPGLGLAICRGLAHLMNGDLSVRSRPDEGSVFTVRLCLPLAAQPPCAEEDEDLETEEPARRIRVLAAEDNPTNQLVLKTLLEQLGISIQMVENGEDAVVAWRGGEWDLVLMDIQMPLMDGLTATRTIRAIEAREGLRRTPIIAVTANATASQAAEYVEAGMDGLVPKPIHFSQLLAAIAGAMDAENDNAADAAAEQSVAS